MEIIEVMHADERENDGLLKSRYTRRLSDKILIAFHQACDQHDLEVAAQLLHVLEGIVTRPPPNGIRNDRRRNVETLVAAHERLWGLRQLSTASAEPWLGHAPMDR